MGSLWTPGLPHIWVPTPRWEREPYDWPGLITPVRAAGFVQGKSNTAASATSITVTFSNPVSAGSLLVAAVQTPNTTGLTVKDSVNGSVNWSVANNHSTSNSANDGGLWFWANTAAGTPTVTVTLAAGNVAVAIGEYSGVVTTTPLDKNGATDHTGATITSGSLTNTGTNGDLCVGMTTQTTQNVAVSNSTSGWSIDVNGTPNATQNIELASFVQGTAGAFTTTFSVVSSQQMSVVVASFKLAAPTAAPPAPLLQAAQAVGRAALW